MINIQITKMNYRANESRTKLVWVMPNAADNA